MTDPKSAAAPRQPEGGQAQPMEASQFTIGAHVVMDLAAANTTAAMITPLDQILAAQPAPKSEPEGQDLSAQELADFRRRFFNVDDGMPVEEVRLTVMRLIDQAERAQPAVSRADAEPSADAPLVAELEMEHCSLCEQMAVDGHELYTCDCCGKLVCSVHSDNAGEHEIVCDSCISLVESRLGREDKADAAPLDALRDFVEAKATELFTEKRCACGHIESQHSEGLCFGTDGDRGEEGDGSCPCSTSGGFRLDTADTLLECMGMLADDEGAICFMREVLRLAALASAEGASAAPRDEMREPPEYEKLLSELEKEKAAHANATEHMGAAIAREKALRRPLERLIEVAQRQWDEKPAKASDLSRINEAREALNTSLMLRPPTEDDAAAAPLGAPVAKVDDALTLLRELRWAWGTDHAWDDKSRCPAIAAGRRCWNAKGHDGSDGGDPIPHDFSLSMRERIEPLLAQPLGAPDARPDEVLEMLKALRGELEYASGFSTDADFNGRLLPLVTRANKLINDLSSPDALLAEALKVCELLRDAATVSETQFVCPEAFEPAVRLARAVLRRGGRNE